MEANTTRQVSCVSLGMVILDEIRMPNKPPLLDVIGGSATFVTLGLRLFATESLVPGCLVLAGSDFPQEIREEMQSWRCNPLTIIDSADQPSSRGLLTYEDSTFGPKTFEYTTPPLRATPTHLINTPLLSAHAFHFFGRPEEILSQIPQLLSHRHQVHPTLPPPFIVWEPLPSSCAPENMALFKQAIKLTDVFSPNHLELAALMPDSPPNKADPLPRLETLGTVLVESGIAPTGAGVLVIRAGADGALALQRDKPVVHVPAFFPPGSDRVVDPTGAGNAFLGGYVAGWLREGDVREALCYGAVAAGFAIEQIGVPRGVDGGMGEERLREFKARVGT